MMMQRWVRNLTVAAVMAVLVVAACAPAHRTAAVVQAAPGTSIDIPRNLRVRVAGRVRTVPLDDYVLGAVLAEVFPLGEDATVVSRVFDLQTIVARTYAVSQIGRHRSQGFDVCDSTHCQIYEPRRIATSRFTADARASVERTAGRILTFNGRVAEALFHADCGGSTTASDAVWGGQTLPYLRTVTDNLPGDTHRAWQVSATPDELRAALNADSRTAVGRSLQDIEIAERDDSGRAAGLNVRGSRSYSVRGDLFRAVLNKALGTRAIQSTKFEIIRTATAFVFEGTGFGHGVGLCQRGAMTRIRRGETLHQIVGVYFPGARVR